jgi:FkbM family methyltransferase
MRVEDIFDYFKLKKLCDNPYEVLRFRKVKDKNRRLTVRLKDGHKMFVQGGTDQYHTFHRVFLRDEYEISRRGDRKMECVIDLGANVGYFSIRLAGLAERVISCEAIKTNVEKLVMNVDGRENICIINKAVAGKKGSIKLFKPTADRCSGRYSMIFNYNSRSEKEFESVECMALDELFEEHRIARCDLMKMDIEGAEYETLYNVSDETFKRIDNIVGEYHHFETGNKGTNIHSLKKYLKKKGYYVVVVPKKRKDTMGLFFCEKC